MTGHVEIESTFDVDASFVVPDLLRLPGVATIEHPLEQHLEAQYLDTPDLRLLRAGITLRRRTGGDDAGWHLKLPVAVSAGRSERLEVHRPLGRTQRTVPTALSRLVRVRVRDQPLVPAARLATVRTVTRLLDVEGQVLAEVADDRVTAEALSAERGGPVTTTSWREIEVELVTGDDDLLAAAAQRLCAAGARPAAVGSKVARALRSRLASQVAAVQPAAGSQVGPVSPSGSKRAKPGGGESTSAAEVLAEAVRGQVDRVLGWDPHVRAQTPGAVTAMRLATRELRSVLAGLAPVLPRAEVVEIKPGLRRLGAVLGEVRSAELLHERVVAAIAGLPPDLIVGPVTRRADADFSARTREALSALYGELDGEEYLELAARLEQLALAARFSGRARQPAETVLAGLVRDHLRKLESAVETFAADIAVQAEVAPAAGLRNARLVWVLRAHEVAALRSIGRTVKRARFLSELAAPVAGSGAEATAQALRELQDVVSSQREGAAMRTALRELAAQATAAGQSAFTFGLLHGLELAGDATQLDEVTGAWRAARKAARTWPA